MNTLTPKQWATWFAGLLATALIPFIYRWWLHDNDQQIGYWLSRLAISTFVVYLVYRAAKHFQPHYDHNVLVVAIPVGFAPAVVTAVAFVQVFFLEPTRLAGLVWLGLLVLSFVPFCTVAVLAFNQKVRETAVDMVKTY